MTLPQAIARVLEAEGQTKRQLTGIAANIGPGGLSATRAGVAFANAFAFGLGVPVAGVAHLDLLGREAARRGIGTVLCVKRAANDTAFAALCRNGRVLKQRFGRFADMLPSIAGGAAVVVGSLPPGGADLLPPDVTLMEGLESPAPETLADAVREARMGEDPLLPLNELSPAFASGTTA